MLRIEFVYFDLGEVIFNFKDSLTNVATGLGFEKDEFLNAWKGPDNRACRGDISPTQMWRDVLEALNYQGDRTDLSDEWLDGFKVNIDVHALVKEVSERCAVGLLTNIYTGFYDKYLARKLIPDVNYAAIVLSSEEKRIKPDPEIFAVAEKRAQITPNKILLLDDLQTNIDVAISRGWTGILYNASNPQETVNKVLQFF